MHSELASLRAKSNSDVLGYRRTGRLTLALVYYFSKKKYSCYTELGLNRWGKLRADFLAINHKKEIIIGEVKQSISDFRNDTKWEHYLPYCNKFYFVFPKKLFYKHKEEIKQQLKDTPTGIMLLDESTGLLYNARKAKSLNIEGSIFDDLLIRMVWRGGISARTTKSYKVYLED